MPREKHRRHILWELFPNDQIDSRCIEEDSDLGAFMASTGRKANIEYYIWSLYEEVDGQVLSEQAAMDAASTSTLGILIYCPKLKVAYYEGEHGSTFILRKPTA